MFVPKECACETRTRLQSNRTGFHMPDQRHFPSLYTYSLHLNIRVCDTNSPPFLVCCLYCATLKGFGAFFFDFYHKNSNGIFFKLGHSPKFFYKCTCPTFVMVPNCIMEFSTLHNVMIRIIQESIKNYKVDV